MIQSRVPALRELIEPGTEIVPVLSDMGAIRGIVCSRVGVLYFVDSASATVHQYSMGTYKFGPNEGTLDVYRANAMGADGLTIDHQGRLLTTYRSPARVTRVDMDGVERELPTDGLRAPSDLVYAIDGSTYVIDSSETGEGGAVLQITRHGESRVATTACGRPGGLTLDPRQLHLLVTDREENCILRFPIKADGSLESPTAILHGPAGLGPLRLDEDGNVYVVSAAGLLIYRYDGIHLGTVELPEKPVNFCWGRSFMGVYVATNSSISFVATKVRGTRTY